MTQYLRAGKWRVQQIWKTSIYVQEAIRLLRVLSSEYHWNWNLAITQIAGYPVLCIKIKCVTKYHHKWSIVVLQRCYTPDPSKKYTTYTWFFIIPVSNKMYCFSLPHFYDTFIFLYVFSIPLFNFCTELSAWFSFLYWLFEHCRGSLSLRVKNVLPMTASLSLLCIWK